MQRLYGLAFDPSRAWPPAPPHRPATALSPALIASSASRLPRLQKENEVILYGGEWYDGERDKTHVYSDVYVLNVEKQAWKKVVSPNG